MPYKDKAKRRKASVKASRKYMKLHPEKYMLINAQKRARNKNLEFTIKLTDINIPQFCPWLGCELTPSGGGKSTYSPSLDRIDNSKGYTPDNIEVISTRANILKSDATLNELICMGLAAARRKK